MKARHQGNRMNRFLHVLLGIEWEATLDGQACNWSGDSGNPGSPVIRPGIPLATDHTETISTTATGPLWQVLPAHLRCRSITR